MAKAVTVNLTIAEANALFSLADCACGEPEYDAIGILGNMASVKAGVRAIEKLFIATHGTVREYARTEIGEQ